MSFKTTKPDIEYAYFPHLLSEYRIEIARWSSRNFKRSEFKREVSLHYPSFNCCCHDWGVKVAMFLEMFHEIFYKCSLNYFLSWVICQSFTLLTEKEKLLQNWLVCSRDGKAIPAVNSLCFTQRAYSSILSYCKKHPYLEKISVFSELHGKCMYICMEMNPDNVPSQMGSTFLSEKLLVRDRCLVLSVSD